ncbi:MAG: arginase family protein [Acidimicrobiales bacterium]
MTSPADDRHGPAAGPSYAFGGFSSFLRAPVCVDLDGLDGDVAILGFPTDEGSTWKPGTRFGPRSMREVSLRFSRADSHGRLGFWRIDSGVRTLDRLLGAQRLVDCGDVVVTPGDVDSSWDDATSRVRKILAAGALPVVLGGDHAITYPILKAYDEPLTIVHVDAHMDYAAVGNGASRTHAHPFRLAAGLDHVTRILHLGIRSFRTSQTEVEDSLADGNVVLTTRELQEYGPEYLSDILPAGERVYVSVDIDVLDLPLVPGVSAAEPDGLQYAELAGLLKFVASTYQVVGMDVAEVNPMLDSPSQVTAFLAVQTVVELLGHVVAASSEHPTPSEHSNLTSREVSP